MVGEFGGSLLLVLQQGLLDLGTGRQGPDLAVVCLGGAGRRTLLYRHSAEDAHLGGMQRVLLAAGAALAAVGKGALVPKAKLTVLGPGPAAIGADLAKAQQFGQTTDPDGFLVGLEVGEGKVRVMVHVMLLVWML